MIRNSALEEVYNLYPNYEDVTRAKYDAIQKILQYVTSAEMPL